METQTVIMIDPDDQEFEVETNNVQAAMDSGLEPAAEFNTPEGQTVSVRKSHFGKAFEQGLKPKDYKEMSMWEAFKSGVGRGAGMWTSNELGEMPEQPELQQEQAWQESPISYGAGVAAANVVPALLGAGVAAGGYQGAKAIGRKVAPIVGPSWQGAKQTFTDTMKSETVPDIVGVTKPAWGMIKGAGTAISQVGDTKKEIAAISAMQKAGQPVDDRSLLQRFLADERGSVKIRQDEPLIGQSILDPGNSPQKQAIAERAATIAPSNLRVDQLNKALEMGTTRRQQARNFLPEMAAEEITPGLKSTLKSLERGKGETYSKLHQQAASEYAPEMGYQIPEQFRQRILSLKGGQEGETVIPAVRGISAPIVSSLETVKQILDSGPAPYGLTPGAWNEAEPQEQYRRLQKARTRLNDDIRQFRASKDPIVANIDSLKQLTQAKEDIDQVMKSIPSQVKADEAYSVGTEARKAMFDAMEFGRGMKKTIDIPTVKKLFGNNDRAYRLQEGIETMRSFLDKYGEDVVPKQREEMRSIVEKFDSLRKQAEDKRLLEGLRQAQGPTSPAMERTAALRSQAGLPQDIFNSPASSMNAVDEFMAQKTKQYFNRNWDSLGQNEKNSMIRLLMWRQQNPNATITEEESMFKKMMKGKK